MIKLHNITLVCVDCLNHKQAIDAIYHCCKDVEFGDVIFFNDLGIYECRIVIDKIKSKEEYSIFMIKELHKYIKTEFALVIQFDGFIINPHLWSDYFLNYDYIGSPWWYPERNVGNGGFSLRSKKFMEVASEIQIENNPKWNGLEDDFLLRGNFPYLISHGVKIAPESVASKFSFEQNMKYPLFKNNTFGFHGYNTLINDIKL